MNTIEPRKLNEMEDFKNKITLKYIILQKMIIFCR